MVRRSAIRSRRGAKSDPIPVLHIDDDPQITRIVAARLAREGFQVTPLNDPTRAIDALVHGLYRIVLMDIDMPQINGLELLGRIKAHDGGIQVVMLTGLVTMTSVLQSLRLGAEACFFKPLDDVEPLVDALRDVQRKLQRWWTTLDELSRQRKRVATAGALN